MFRIADGIRGCIRPGVPQPAGWQRIADQIDTAMIFTRADLVDVHIIFSEAS